MSSISSKNDNNFYRMSIAAFISTLITSIICIIILLWNELAINQENILQMLTDNDYRAVKMLGVASLALIICGALCLRFKPSMEADETLKEAQKQLEEIKLE